MKKHIVWLVWILSMGLMMVTGCCPKVIISSAPEPITQPEPRPEAKPKEAEPFLKQLPMEEYPYFSDRYGYAKLSAGIKQSLVYLHKLPPQRQIPFGDDHFSVAHLIRSLETFGDLIEASPDTMYLNRQLLEHFRVYATTGAEETNVLFTGYYEPILKGSTAPSTDFPIPIYSRPDDLVEIDLSKFSSDLKGRSIVGQYADQKMIPYPDRADIRKIKNFQRLAPPIAWLRDEVDLFNLMVQGSGKIQLETGKIIQVGFDVSNGRPYRSIGRMLINQNKISASEMSMEAIRTYLYKHPHEAQDILNHNPRYIFFRRVSNGPIGALGVPLTPNRSIAIDRSLYPSAALAFIDLTAPVVNGQGVIEKWVPMRCFALAQDTGSAIKGPARVDWFKGHGRQAEVAASHLKHYGRLYFLVLKPEIQTARE